MKKEMSKKNSKEEELEDEEESGLEEDVEDAEEEIDNIQLQKFISPTDLLVHTTPSLEKIKTIRQESSLEQDVSSIPIPEKGEEDFRRYEADFKYSEIKYGGESSKYKTDTESQSRENVHSRINEVEHAKSKRRLPFER